ncbi:MFS transporter [Candidatus Wolfebacteria bacterium]|nr:MFS transporter [Candidatus Wolfebacteria bacterium]
MARFFLEKIFPDGVVPRDVKFLTWATTVRFMGWSFVESLIPVFLFSFARNYAETGLLRSIFDIVYILAVPFVGILADKISTRTILIIGILFYPFVGFFYFWAGVTGVALFIVAARFFNGIGFAFDSIGRSTYFRKHVNKPVISTAFGYFDSVTNFFWVLGVLFSLILIKIFPVHALFLAIIPTSLIALVMFFYLKKDGGKNIKDGVAGIFKDGIFYSMWNEMRGWNKNLRLISFVTFYLGFIGVVNNFIIPIDVYKNGGNYQQIILIGAVLALPYIFGFYLGEIADEKRKISVLTGIAFISLFFLLLAFTENYALKLIFVFGLSLAFDLIILAFAGITTQSVSEEHYGRLSSILADSGSLGALFGPIVLGILADILGLRSTFIIFSLINIVIFILLLVQLKNFSQK